jgi:hypothetical protein
MGKKNSKKYLPMSVNRFRKMEPGIATLREKLTEVLMQNS